MVRMKRISVSQFICQVFRDYDGQKVLLHDEMSVKVRTQNGQILILIVTKSRQAMILF